MAGATEQSTKCLPCKEKPEFNPQNPLKNKLGTVTEKPNTKKEAQTRGPLRLSDEPA